MEYGVVFPTMDIGSDPAAIRDYAQAAEELGYRKLLIYDHVVGVVHTDREPPLWGPYDERHPFHEVMVLFGYLAACTTTLGLMSGVLVLPQRQTALVAKQTAEIDLLSRGRLTLGVGIGWNHVEYQTLGVPYTQRGRRLEEQVELLRLLWTQDVVNYEGDFHRIDRAGIAPRPERRIPVWFGGSSEAALARAARIGDGFLMQAKPEPLRQAKRLRALLEQEGRTDDGFEMAISTDYGAGADHWLAVVDQWRGVGGTLVSVRALETPSVAEWYETRMAGLRSVGDHIDALERFMTTVGGP